MLITASKLQSAQVLSLHTGQVVAQTTGIIIDPNKLAVIGFYCQTNQKNANSLALLASDVRQSAAGRLFINSYDELSLPTELVRYKDVFDLKFMLISKKVKTVSHHKLGKVEDYAIETIGWVIQKIYASQSLFKSLGNQSLAIDRTQIVEVTDQDITVNDAVITKPASIPQPIPELPTA